MFEKLLSTLPYNPGLTQQVVFYGRRMREEASIRRTGMIFLVLAFMVQFFAVFNPPKPASAQACSGNDLVYCGISSAKDAAVACHNNVRGYGAIMDYYGIPCGDILNAKEDYIHAHDFNNQLYSLGNNPYGKPGETAVKINDNNTVFWRFLWGWPYGNTPIHVLKFNENGRIFFIMFDCGNLVTPGIPPKAPPTGKIGLTPNTPVPQPKPKTPAPTPTPTPSAPPPSLVTPLPSCTPTTCITVRKSAANITQNLPDANNTTANPGDVITYTLYAQNTGKYTVKRYVFEENLDDVLVYADVADLHGGVMDSNHKITWPQLVDIKAGQTATVQVTVKVKDPIPQTPVTANDPYHYDLTMTNVYGNTINVKLPGSPQKTIETTAATLPNTGPGTSLFIGSVVVIMAGYFYSRARLLAKESDLAVQESAAA